VHASIWRFVGDPSQLLRRYDAMLAEVPTANMRLHLCLQSADGFVLVDTCPTKQVYDAFAKGEAFRSLRDRHSLPAPVELADFPVHVAIADGRALR
jgi:hypothetical protein